MKVWLILIQEGQGYTWLEAAMDDESTAENSSRWKEEVDRCRKLAYDNHYEMRIASVVVDGAYELFEADELVAVKVEPEENG